MLLGGLLNVILLAWGGVAKGVLLAWYMCRSYADINIGGTSGLIDNDKVPA